MRKFIISAIAAASLLGVATAANAYPYIVNVPVCQWVFNGFGWINVCY